MRGSKMLMAMACIVPLAVPALPFTVHAAPMIPARVVAPAGPPSPAEVTPVGSSKYVAVAPQRLADTRLGSNGGVDYQDLSASTIRVPILNRTDGTAVATAGATAAVLNVTIAGSSGAGYVTVYPGGSPLPNSSSLNADQPGRVVANLVHVKIGSDGAANVYRSVAMNIVVDLVGVYVPAPSEVKGGRLVTLPNGALRVLDTRSSGPVGANGYANVNVAAAGIPTTASAVVVTMTAVDASPGFWTAFPAGQSLPRTSSLNLDQFLQTRAGQAIVNLVGTNQFQVYSQTGGHLLIDVVGYFTGAQDSNPASIEGLYLPAAPARLLDTRLLRTLAPWSGSTYEISVANPPSISVGAAVLNVTATAPWDRGYVTAYPARLARPVASNLNISSLPQTIANHAITRVSTYGVALFTQGGTHLVADVAGWYLGPASTATQAAPVNPVYLPNPASSVYIPKIGVHVAIKSGGGSLDYIADQGYAATWSDINKVATPGNLMLFGHRTTGSAPFRHINNLVLGDTFTVIGTDGRSYNYVVVHKAVTTPTYSKIQALAAPFGPVTAQLVACSKLDGTATSTSYRLVVTGRLFSVT